MKRILFALIGIIALLGLFGVGTAHAIDARAGNNATISKEELLDSNAYVAGTTVTVAGTVKGDLYCAGQNIDITGTIEGDVLCAGQTVRIGGQVYGDVRAAAQTLTVTGNIQGSVTLAGQTATIAEEAVIGRDATVMSSNVFIAGRINRDLVGGGQEVTLNGHIARNVDVNAEQLNLQKTAHVGGNLTYVSNNNVNMEPGAAVDGKTNRQDPPKHEKREQTAYERVLGGPVYWLLAFLLIGFVIMGLSPKAFDTAATTLRERPLVTLATGALSFIVIPILAFLALLTVIGIPLSFAILALWFPIMLVGFAVGSYCMGALLAKQFKWNKWRRTLSLITGLLIVMIVSLVPYVGGIVTAFVLIWGIGGFLVMLLNHIGSDKRAGGKAKKAAA